LTALLFAFTRKSAAEARKDRRESVIIITKRVRGLKDSVLARFVSRAKRAAKVAGAVNVMVTSSREMRRLNQRFRGKNMPTDVLSFPVPEAHSSRLAGDVAISAEIAVQNARRLKHAAADEIKILILHGVLHLAGYDHEGDRGEMAREEARLRRVLHLPLGLIERNGSRPQAHKLLSAGKTRHQPTSLRVTKAARNLSPRASR
jgi:probable rRNA maturation factor